MKRYLWISNIILLFILILISLKYNIPHKIYDKIFDNKAQVNLAEKNNELEENLNCVYDLKYFDFHYNSETDSPNIIMFGNSLVRHADWNKLLNRNDILNRGISGDNLPCMCERLKYLKDKNAKIWFIEGGINDLPQRNTLLLFEKYKEIVEFVKSEKSIPVINMVLYISPKAGEKFPSRINYSQVNDSIYKLNNLLKEYSIKNKIEFIDLNKEISNNDKILKSEFTTDGVHLTKDAYKKWTKQINEIIKKYNKKTSANIG